MLNRCLIAVRNHEIGTLVHKDHTGQFGSQRAGVVGSFSRHCEHWGGSLTALLDTPPRNIKRGRFVS